MSFSPTDCRHIEEDQGCYGGDDDDPGSLDSDILSPDLLAVVSVNEEDGEGGFDVEKEALFAWSLAWFGGFCLKDRG